jgi:hypothetical protein
MGAGEAHHRAFSCQRRLLVDGQWQGKSQQLDILDCGKCLDCVLLAVQDRIRRVKGIAKCLKLLGKFCASYHSDEGCEEGTAYWNHAGGALFDCLDLLHMASNGAIDEGKNPLAAEIGRKVAYQRRLLCQFRGLLREAAHECGFDSPLWNLYW